MLATQMTPEATPIEPTLPSPYPAPRDLLLTAAIVSGSAILAWVAERLFGDVAGALILVLGIIIAGGQFGLVCALAASFLAFLAHNFYLTEPALSFRVTSASHVAPFIIFNLCALVAGVLAGRLKDHARRARLGALRLEHLLALSNALQSAARQQDVAAAVARAAYHLLGAKVSLFRAVEGGVVPLEPPPHDDSWRAFAAHALVSDEPALEDERRIARRLAGSGGALGVMVIEPYRDGRFDSAFIDAIAGLVALALERAEMSEAIADARAVGRADELASALLSSVSHDFRTPLAAISASASSLIAYREQLDPPTSDRLLRGIVEECERLNRYTANLLEMSRIEAGGPVAPLEPLSVAEMLGAAINRVRPRAGSRKFLRAGEADVIVAANAALFELVLINVLDNAVRYSADGTSICIAVARIDGRCRLTIADEGIGIPAEDLERVFTRFHRVERAEPAPRGSGLGLAIARGFVQALGGTIEARAPGVGNAGTQIVIHLPAVEEAEAQ